LGLTVPATCPDHILAHKGDHYLMWHPGNWQSACDFCHSVVKQQLEALYAKGQATKADMRLSSEKAKNLSKNLRDGG